MEQSDSTKCIPREHLVTGARLFADAAAFWLRIQALLNRANVHLIGQRFGEEYFRPDHNMIGHS